MKANFIVLFFATLFVALTSCNKDSEKSPELEIVFDEVSYSLIDAAIYFIAEYDADPKYREYIITDGEYNGGYPWQMSSYTDANYMMALTMYVLPDRSFDAGTYLAYGFMGSDEIWNSTDKVVEFWFYDGETYYQHTADFGHGAPMVVKGSFDEGGKISVALVSPIGREVYLEGQWTYVLSSVKLYYEGVIQAFPEVN
jgi:hypothetical protein